MITKINAPEGAVPFLGQTLFYMIEPDHMDPVRVSAVAKDGVLELHPDSSRVIRYVRFPLWSMP